MDSVAFPLTPFISTPISLAALELFYPGAMQTRGIHIALGRETILPLLEGEGRGEGKLA